VGRPRVAPGDGGHTLYDEDGREVGSVCGDRNEPPYVLGWCPAGGRHSKPASVSGSAGSAVEDEWHGAAPSIGLILTATRRPVAASMPEHQNRAPCVPPCGGRRPGRADEVRHRARAGRPGSRTAAAARPGAA
jgi:hypothetical protein